MITHSCGARWTNTRYAHCAACHETFGGLRAFDMHRHDGSCIDPSSHPKLHAHDDGSMIVWKQTRTS